MFKNEALRKKAATTVRMLAADMVQGANSGHPGAPLGLADVALTLWSEYLRFDPRAPRWPARDRFILSGGHASTLLYALLHLFQYDLPMDEIKRFRQWDSITPGHPEVGLTPGVEMTTGPLGQGAATSVGFAVAAKHLHAVIDVPGDPFQAMPQRVFAVMGDGDMMEGVVYEAASLAGHFALDNLYWLYDDNKITIDGTTDLAFTEDVAGRFTALGWRVLRADGHNADSLRAALSSATNSGIRKPTLIICRTHIGFGSPNRHDTSGVHGTPLGEEELAATKQNLGWPVDARYYVPDDVASALSEIVEKKRADHAAYDAAFEGWRARHPDKAALFDEIWSDEVPSNLYEALLEATPAAGATRVLSNAAVKAAMAKMPGLIGGSADLSGSNGLKLGCELFGNPEARGDYKFSFGGRQIPFGIREHAMGALTNGICLHGGLRAFGGTFHAFSDYERPAIRLAALSHLRNIFVLTHDSIFLGEDGPTHQPVEHHWALRVIPNLDYWRPADGVETAMAWAYALQLADGPSALALTRQKVKALPLPEGFDKTEIWKGAYAVIDCKDPDVILVGTGSEVSLCIDAAAKLSDLKCRVISMPCYERFCEQTADYKEALIPSDHPCVVTVEAGLTGPWHQLTGRKGLCIGLDHFGASAPDTVLAEKFGFTADQVAAKIRAHLGK